jgi:mono/diheme cytochrome c family protein
MAALLILLFTLLSFNSDANEGKIIYANTCAKCHNINPNKSGIIGPDIANSSLELITSKTQKRQYPKNYKPKRKTNVMPIIKLSQKQLESLFKYINNFIKKK